MSENVQINSHSIVSLTLGILSIFIPFIGFILGIIGIIMSRKATKEMDKTNQTGRGLAISGLICSLVGIVMQIFIVLGFIAFFLFVRAV
ncbi:DUF4190 domain-containing protein [Lentibacillus sp.]|uniref:DUF4190 domain-containing protein n=1 Tax=Lentibacillus sp. TaxID=1925746 RepID=UPI002B4B24D3|nr:DUF4190 domain-containing protein [Lentibacillus sp.]HLS08904.1 DUF4190 domain-containing protein [Lentibacillus sp.]